MALQQDEGIKVNHWSPERGTPPGLYDAAGTVPKLAGFDQVDDAAVQQFRELGFLAIEPAFTTQEIQDAIDGLMDCVAGRKKGFDLNVEAGVKDWEKVKRPDARLRRVRKLNQFVDSDERLHHLCYHPALLGLLERLMGEPPKMYANQALLKPPRIGSEKPWHQDMAYFKFGPDIMVIGAWIALDPATPENGCMHLVPGTHRDGPAPHFRIRDWQLCDRDVDVPRCLAAPLAPGGVLIFHGLLHHGTPPNHSAATRRALQFHYSPESAPMISQEERLAVWGAEALGAEC